MRRRAAWAEARAGYGDSMIDGAGEGGYKVRLAWQVRAKKCEGEGG